MPIPTLLELYFAFNAVTCESLLTKAVENNKNLGLLVVTGNPFAVDNQTSDLESALDERGGQLVNEPIEPPEYMKGAR